MPLCGPNKFNNRSCDQTLQVTLYDVGSVRTLVRVCNATSQYKPVQQPTSTTHARKNRPWNCSAGFSSDLSVQVRAAPPRKIAVELMTDERCCSMPSPCHIKCNTGVSYVFKPGTKDISLPACITSHEGTFWTPFLPHPSPLPLLLLLLVRSVPLLTL